MIEIPVSTYGAFPVPVALPPTLACNWSFPESLGAFLDVAALFVFFVFVLFVFVVLGFFVFVVIFVSCLFDVFPEQMRPTHPLPKNFPMFPAPIAFFPDDIVLKMSGTPILTWLV